MVYDSAAGIDFSLADLARVPLPGRVLFTTPAHFGVEYVINPHMRGNIGSVDIEKAVDEWKRIVHEYETLGLRTHILEGSPGLPDMVFCANQTLPFLDPVKASRGVVLSHMHAPQRAPEVPFFAEFFRDLDYAIEELPDDVADFEGMGDAIWHPGRFMLWGGYGFRSSRRAYDVLAERLEVDILILRLDDPDFYHLDTCLSALDESTALIFPGAFDDRGRELIRALFETVIEAPEDEARGLFACNAHCPDGTNVIIQAGCSKTVAELRKAGFNPIEVHSEEFLKAGGSVFCMKQMFW